MDTLELLMLTIPRHNSSRLISYQNSVGLIDKKQVFFHLDKVTNIQESICREIFGIKHVFACYFVVVLEGY